MDDFVMLKILGEAIAVTSVSLMTGVSLGHYSFDKGLSKDDVTFVKIESMPQEFVRDNRKYLETAGLKKEVVEVADEFVDVTSKLGVDLSNFYSNFNRYNIIVDDKRTSKWKVKIEPKDRELVVSSKNLRKDLLYGFLLLSSTSYVDGISAVGFTREKVGDYTLGYGLNRGYINNFLKWNFLETDIESQVLANLAFSIENLVGTETMRNAFFNGALEDVVEVLAKYSDVEDATIVVREMDHINAAYCVGSLVLSGLSMKVYKDIIYRLSNMYIKKMKEEEMDSREDLARDVMLFSDMLEKRAPLIRPFTYHVPKKDKTMLFKRLDDELKSHSVPSILG